MRLRGELGGVFALRRLLRDTQHRSDFGPGTIGFSSAANRVQQCGVDTVSLFNQLRDRPKSRSPGLDQIVDCLLYTSDAADERSSVDLGGRRIIKKKQTV